MKTGPRRKEPDSHLEDLFSDNKTLRDQAILMYVTKRIDPASIEKRIEKLELVDFGQKFRGTRFDEVLNTLALTYRRYGYPQFAKRILNALIVRGSNQPPTLSNLGQIYKELGEEDKASEMFQRAYDLTF